MDHKYLVANQLLVVNDRHNDIINTGEYLADGTPKLKKVSRTIVPGEIFAVADLDADPAAALETALAFVNDVPDWCCDLNPEDHGLYTAARWATDVEGRLFADQAENANG